MKSNKLYTTLSVLFLALIMSSAATAKKAPKVDICHFDKDAGLFHVINVSGNSVSKHKKLTAM